MSLYYGALIAGLSIVAIVIVSRTLERSNRENSEAWKHAAHVQDDAWTRMNDERKVYLQEKKEILGCMKYTRSSKEFEGLVREQLSEMLVKYGVIRKQSERGTEVLPSKEEDA